MWSRQNRAFAVLRRAVQQQLQSPFRCLSAATGGGVVPPATIVSPDWVASNLAGVKLVDASWFMPADKIDAHKNYLEKRLPGARYFDVETIADTSFGLPHMMPRPDVFRSMVGTGLGLSERDTIIVYDTRGMFSAPRVWYTLKLFGAANVSILDGGMPLWLKQNRPIESGPLKPFTPAVWNVPTAASGPSVGANVLTAKQVLSNLRTQTALTVDARSAERFAGSVPEPRASLRRGHIPFSVNIPFTELLRKDPKTDTMHLKGVPELRRIYEAVGIDFPTPLAHTIRPIVNTCGSGMTACINIFALYTAGYPLEKLQLFDGSWTEWGGNPDLPVESFVPGSTQTAAGAMKGAAAAAAKK